MISLNSISKHYGGDWLFHKASLRIGDRERIAIVGPNGAGKSTVMKIIMGLVEPDEGDIAQSRTNTVGYLPQDGVQHGGKTLYDEASSAFEDILALHDQAEQLSTEISRLSAEVLPDDRQLLARIDELGEVQHLLEHREGYNIQTRVAQVLAGLGFQERDFQRETDEFSGGWQMRIALAKLLLREPTILLLDEPTNHLDLESLEWLEQYLMAYENSLVLISHDRRFLDTLVNRTVEITMGKMTEYSGNFSYYIDEKALRMQQQRAQFENQQQHIKQTQQFIERFRYKNTKARQVQSRVKMLEKMERVELEDEEGGISFDFPDPPQPGRILMELQGIKKNYGNVKVLEGLDFTIERGDRIAFLGVNGIGKSTLARIIAGAEPFQAGERKPGHNCSIAYYAQNQAEELDPQKTVLETLDVVAVGDVRKRLRTLLGCFMFSGDAVEKKVRVLSGGEKSRLALAKMLLTPSNLLVLDEPTNHLDMRSKTVLQDALSRFEGSYIIVSHDRDFLEPLINKCVDFHDGHSRETIGTVSDYIRKRHDEAAASEKRDSAGHAVLKKNVAHRDRDRRREQAELRQERYRKIKPLKNESARLEKRIEERELFKLDIENRLADEATYRDQARARELTSSYQAVQDELMGMYQRWEELQLLLEELHESGDDES